ncbi:hypothetical protein NMU03_01860 [Allocoprobacillus halotolerans]|uniref:DUF4367 domain-containing protein n=1 Tax=Allocoprobacillus halotolerans TaxID=2944914 RepID=A0ABY5I4F2_9FIRM|nr:hypothetical protein [Allocoprobacillus halotolerans]UTY39603.1 hypothetical protein NMU03_01860 [Allocoprobacillus halotolerans]
MKKVIIVILIWLTVLSGCMIYLCLNHENEKEEESAAGLPIPACYVQNHVYFTRYDREEDEVHQVEKDFAYYGTINEYVDFSMEDDYPDLSTYDLGYMNRDVYVNQDDDTYIYVRMNHERYLVLYYDDASTDQVLEVIQSNK